MRAGPPAAMSSLRWSRKAWGRVEAAYYAFGATDLYVIGEVPDEVAAVALSVRHRGRGGAHSQRFRC